VEMGRPAERGWGLDVMPTWTTWAAQHRRRESARQTGLRSEVPYGPIAATVHRGERVPDVDPAGEPDQAARVVINYRASDCPGYAMALYLELSHRFGSDLVFMDTESIPAGGDFVRYLFSQLRGCQTMLSVIGPGWLVAADPADPRPLDDPQDWIRRELVVAF